MSRSEAGGGGAIRVLNTQLDCLDRTSLAQRFLSCRLVVTPNVDHLWNLQTRRELYRAYQAADLRVCDSRVLSLALRAIFGVRVEAIPGSEFFPELFRRFQGDKRFRVFLLGGSTARHTLLAAEKLGAVSPGGVVGSYCPPFGFENSTAELNSIVARIKDSGASVVAIGVGSPKQENVAISLMKALPGVTFVGVGATIDFESGLVRRAPRIFRLLYLEWLYRFLLEPRRMFSRYFVRDVRVFGLLVWQRLGLYQDPFRD